MKKKLVTGVCVLTMVLGLFTAPQQSIQAAKKIYVTQGETTRFAVKHATKKTKWSVKSKRIAAVASAENAVSVKGKKKGKTTIHGKLNDKKKQYTVVVETPAINKKKANIHVNDTVKLKIGGTSRSVSWSSDNAYIASVDAKTGVVTGKNEGDTVISAKVGSRKYKCKVFVTEVRNYTMEELRIPNGTRTVYGKVYKPNTGGKHPVILMCHGYNGWADDFTNECKYYANNGYIAYALDFCGGSARSRSTGLKTTEMTIFTEKEDLLAAIDYFYALDEVDQSRLYTFGGSQGGLVCAMATEERKDQVCAMALYFPAFNIPDNWRGNFPDVSKIPAEYEFWGLKLGRVFFSSMHDYYTFDQIGTYEKNVYILQGNKDNIVPHATAQKAVSVYPKAKLKIMDGEGHGFSQAGGKVAMEEVLSFMEENQS